jgi:cyclin B
VEIDAADGNNELAVVEYVDDMYEFYKLTEVKISPLSLYIYLCIFLSLSLCDTHINITSFMQVDSRVHDYLQFQPDINAKMRSILVDWLIDVHRKFLLMPETLYLTINIVDRFLALKLVPRRELQLVGISSMLIACKYEEIWAPEVQYSSLFNIIAFAFLFFLLNSLSRHDDSFVLKFTG